MDGDYTVNTGYYSLATGAAATALITHIPKNANGDYAARMMLIRAVGNNVNYTLDGTVPTAAAGGGMPLNTADTSPFQINNLANIERFQAISTTGTGSVSVLFFT